eukprot:85277_1
MSTLLVLITTIFSTCLADNGNIMITNGAPVLNISYYACTISDISPGYTLTGVSIRMANYEWFECTYSINRWTCAVTSDLPNTALSLRLTAYNIDNIPYTITGYHKISSYQSGSIFDFGSNFAKELPTPIPTMSPTTPHPTISPTTPTTQPTNKPIQDGTIVITNRAGSTSWWYTIVISGVSTELTVEKVFLKHAETLTWIEGIYYRWGNYWAFNVNGPFVPPFSFKITASSGETIVSNDVINSLAANAQGEMDQSFSENYETDDDKGGVSWVVWVVIVFIILIIICVVIGVIIYKKKAGESRGYQSDTLDLNETEVNKDKAMEQKKEFEMITTGNTGANDDDAMIDEIEVDENVEENDV